jgi:hypothetical protein
VKPTREQILTQPAGKGMDLWIVEHIFKSSEPCTGEDPLTWPAFSESMAAAWEVVEEMRRRGCLPTLLERANGGWRAQLLFTDGEGFRHWPGAAADSPALAVCRAALLACVDAQVQP